MTDPFYHENNAIASWFLGPRAENSELVRKFYNKTINQQKEARRNYFPDDPFFITRSMQNSAGFKRNMRYLQKRLNLLSDKLAQKTIPYWSPRYMAHMTMESSIPANLGYLAALQYNQNNVAIEGSPLTTWLEIFVGKQLCELLGFDSQPENVPRIQGWGHITCDGSVANLESIWYAHKSRNLKFYPLSVRLAIDEGSLSFIGSSFKVELANGQEYKLLIDCTTWELLNLKPVTILDIPDRLYKEHGITPQFLQNALKDYSIQTVGKDYLEKKFQITDPILYFTTTTIHYSWPKGCAIVGIGSKNLKPVPVDNSARMDMNELNKLLIQCVQNKQAIYAVVAIMGSTEHGACDPLGDIIKLRTKFERHYGLSFVIHADAAWGGYFRSMLIKPPIGSRHEKESDSFLPKLALNSYTEEHLDNLKNCDSVTIDPHKSGYIPYPAGGLCYRDQRMRYLVTWASPVIIRPNEESIGIYGVEGSKPGAASAATWLSHDTIGLHQKGYGTLLGKVAFTCSKIYCHWATMSTNHDDFTITPFNMLPSEKRFPLNLEAIEKQKTSIRKLIVERTDREIVESEAAKNLIKQLGSDLTVNAFVCNFKIKVKENNKIIYKVNEDINEANYLNQRLYEKFSFTSAKDTNADKSIILTSTRFRQKDYGDCLTNFKNRIGLKGDQDLYVLVNVVMSPWVTESGFFHELTKKFKSTLQDIVKLSIIRNTVKPDHHKFVIQGTDQLFFTNLSMFQMENQRQQVIITADIPSEIKDTFLKLRKDDPSHVYYLGNQYKMTLDEIARNGRSFMGVIYKNFDPKNKKAMVLIKGFQVTNVRVLKKRHLGTTFQDETYNDHMPFYIYGTGRQLHIDHMLLKYPSIQLSAECIKLEITSGNLTQNQRERGIIAHIIDVRENTMQPFQETEKLGNSFFFQEGRTFHVELYEDPIPDPYQNGPGLNNVYNENPFAIGTIRLPLKNEGCVFVDSYFINKDPTADRKIK
ncbi:pyridoxal phosphate-dependent transferase [Glomus cerebriforme]|uniref:Pyridoxal phosphate-dependent transferase n=1 Tax=Glomus cerebriforme TaxID=658196 RepID=A0A397TI69_9GLOM|nr:pyridoxal phosphate-dependent transferase [Glomus cerebriforme]